MKYYFITYEGIRRDNDPSRSIWYQVIARSPIDFLMELLKSEEEAEEKGRKSYYKNFIIISCIEITEMDYIRYKDKL